MVTVLNDNNLFLQIKEENRLAFESLFYKYYRALGAFAYRFVEDVNISEDIVQDVFFRIWENKEWLVINTSVKSYLYSSVRNSCLNYLKREETKSNVLTEKVKELNMISDNNTYELEELSRILFECISELPPRCRSVFQESRFNGRKQKEISENLKISVNTVKVQITKALSYLHECLDQKYYTPEKESISNNGSSEIKLISPW